MYLDPYNQGRKIKFLNIFQEYNPRLTGYSTGTGEFISGKARLNIAYPVAATEDALHQARILVQRMRSDPAIDIERHWKVRQVKYCKIDVCAVRKKANKQLTFLPVIQSRGPI